MFLDLNLACLLPHLELCVTGCAVMVGTPGRLHDLMQRHDGPILKSLEVRQHSTAYGLATPPHNALTLAMFRCWYWMKPTRSSTWDLPTPSHPCSTCCQSSDAQACSLPHRYNLPTPPHPTAPVALFTATNATDQGGEGLGSCWASQPGSGGGQSAQCRHQAVTSHPHLPEQHLRHVQCG